MTALAVRTRSPALVMAGRATGAPDSDHQGVNRARHVPVLLGAALQMLEPERGGCFLDATFGDGGYSRALIDGGAARVLALDRDPDAVARGRAGIARGGIPLTVAQALFGDLAEVAARHRIGGCRGVVFDLGVSSMQLDAAERGFSFLHSGPLDMRMGRSGIGAAEIVNAASEAELADIIHVYGEDRLARRIARAIVRERDVQPVTTTDRLAAIVADCVPRQRGAIHPATRTFQALRIAVNDELRQLACGLAAAEALLAPGGVLCVVAFHSLEDRIVKQFLAGRATRANPNRHLPEPREAASPSFELLNRRPLRPGASELQANPRARSARLRAARRTTAPAWPAGTDALRLPLAATHRPGRYS